MIGTVTQIGFPPNRKDLIYLECDNVNGIQSFSVLVKNHYKSKQIRIGHKLRVSRNFVYWTGGFESEFEIEREPFSIVSSK